MKVGFLYDAVYPWIKGGGEKALYELASALRDRGHECHLFGMHLWDGPADIVRDGLHYHAVCPNIPLYTADGRRRTSQPLRFAWGVLTRLPRYDLKSFDLLDVHAFPIASAPAFWLVHALRARRVPWLLTWLEVWGSDYWRNYLGFKGRIGAAVERWCARVAPHHLCISPNTGRRLHELLGVDSSRISVIPRGFVPPPGDGPAPLKAASTAVIAGRLRSYKRVDVAVRAWPAVVAQLPEARLRIVGDGPQRDELQQLATKLGMNGHITFCGQLPERRKVLDEIASAELLLQPSQREGQSIVVLEALTLGTPALAAVGPETAVSDFLGSGPAAELAKIDVAAPPEAWADRIVRLLSDQVARAALVATGRGQVSDLEWDRHIAPAVEQLYLRHIAASQGSK